MGQVERLRCVSCGDEYESDELNYCCPDCGPRRGTLEVIYDYEQLTDQLSKSDFSGKPESIDRYLPLLPVKHQDDLPDLRVGGTPLYSLAHLTDSVDRLWLKDDSPNPTASYKDRASAMVIGAAREKDISTLACASTGNAASSLAGLSASTDMDTFIFVPRRTPAAKVAQLLVYGAHVFSVFGSYDEAYDLCLEAVDRYGWYNRSAAINPYLVEGKKTGALELADQLNWDVPDKVLVSVGDGSIISGLCKGFLELKRIGLIARVPEVVGVQSAGANPIERSFREYSGDEVHIEDQGAETIADSIAVGKPRDIVKAVKYVHQVDGDFVTVSDEEIQTSIVELAQRTGVFAEPAGAVPYAGFKSLESQNYFDPSEEVALFVTGSGLKDTKAARDAISQNPMEVEPDMAQLDNSLSDHGLI